MSDLATALTDPHRKIVMLYGTTPPRADAPEERIQRAATRLARRVRGMRPDGLVVYDVQDEAGRTAEPRPFPFLPTLSSRVYARLLREETGRAAVTYKCVAGVSEENWGEWLSAADETYGVRCLTLVGRATSKGGLTGISLGRAYREAAAHPAGFVLGGVAIPERHTPERSESLRLLEKMASGCEYFISQAVYDPEAAIALLKDYGRDCAERGQRPKRIVLTFTPCGRPETMQFLHWLGIRISGEVERAILGAADPLAESVRFCAEGMRRILESGAADSVPLGFNVESVSIKKEEIDATADLFAALRDAAG